MPQQYKGGRINFSIKWYWYNESIMCQKNEPQYFLPITHKNSKWIMTLKVRPYTIKLLEEKEKNLSNTRLGKDFWNRKTENTIRKEKINVKHLFLKRHCKKRKGKPQTRRKYLKNIQRTCKTQQYENKQSNNKIG